jgi:hypothetical protein
MSELNAGHRACPKMQRAALPGGPNRKSDFNEPVETTETVREIQAASLRRFALGYYLAATVAHLAFAVSR